MLTTDVIYSTELPPETGYTSDSIFYHPDYLSQLTSDVVSFYAVDQSTSELILSIHFQILNQKAVSLWEAPFGGIESSKYSDPSVLFGFMNYIFDQLRSKNIKEIIIKSAPDFHRKFQHNPEFFTEKNFEIYGTDINHHLVITEADPSEHFSTMQKRRLKKSLSANFECRHEDSSRLDTLYSFITKCRKQKNHEMPVSFDRLAEAIQKLPDTYHLISIYDGNQLIAATVSVAVSKDVLYNFMPASSRSHDTYSPMVLLIDQLYRYGREHDFKVLDLGTSMTGSELNFSLIAFKERMGGIESKRNIYRNIISHDTSYHN
ncbi:MAG: GNAT family N-acetyltransferase [Reichenbachiella sp.]|uniref:GNAT family N-acetyltransferase n=1 Tax=Reichenbachiella sp. TaxID=2184521 RepID=UPI0032658235